MKTSDIAAVIKRDLLRRDTRPTTNIVACHSCGRSYRYKGRDGDKNGMFCSDRCRDWYDAGNPSYEEQRPKNIYPMRQGPHGFYINCVHCEKEFDSKGLRCCSVACERAYCERRDNLAIMAEVGMEPAAKRRCGAPDCNTPIPRWRNGRRVSKATRFCSLRCARSARVAADSQNVANVAETIKKSA